MTQAPNGTVGTDTTLQPLLSLVGHLTDAQDRETYAALVSYFHSLPPGDELSRLAQLLGFLSLFGQRLPNALAEFLEVIRSQSKAAAEYHQKVDERLARLPWEITAGVDAGAIAKAMSEAFRQQLAATGLQDTVRLLDASLDGLKRATVDVSATVRSYTGIAATVSTELAKLRTASNALRQYNMNLVAQVQEERRLWKGLLGLALLLIGGICGILLEKRQTSDLINDMNTQLQRIQAPVVPAAAGLARRK